MSLVQQAKTEDWPTVQAAIQNDAPTTYALVVASFFTPDPQVREGLLALLAERPAEDGVLPVHRLALAGDADGIAAVEADQLDAPVAVPTLWNSSLLGRWTAAHIAAACGHVEVLEALQARGVDVDVQAGVGRERPLDQATRYGRTETVRWLLDAGCAPGQRTVSNLSPGVPDALLDALLDAGLDLNDDAPGYSMAFHVMYPQGPLAPKVELIRRLVDRGLRLDAQLLFELLEALRDEEDVPAALDALLGIEAPDLAMPIVDDGIDRRGTLMTFALERWPIGAARRLAEAGADVPSVRVASRWPDADAKRAWLETLGKAPGEPDLREFMRLSEEQITPERVVRLIAGPGMAIAGVPMWASAADLQRLGLGRSRDGYTHASSELDIDDPWARHDLQLWADRGEVRSSEYHGYFGRSDDAEAVFEALKKAYTEALGKPRGRKNLSWRAPGAKLTLRMGHQSDPMATWHTVRLELEGDEETRELDSVPEVPERPLPPLDELAQGLCDSFNDFGPDSFEPCPTFDRATITREGDTFTLTLHMTVAGEADVSSIAWDNQLVDEHGSFTMDVIEAMSEDVADVLTIYRDW